MMYNGSMNKKTENKRRKLCIFYRISIGRAHGLIKIIKIFFFINTTFFTTALFAKHGNSVGSVPTGVVL